ncbi:MAG: hypothetical protein JSR58_05040 [Verrucomicrobia bacterium]|nr:hypothetical protein [Verrucomicrobiota bacterium]
MGMLTFLFLVLAAITGYFAFKKGPKTGGKQVAKAFFYVFVVLFVIMIALILVEMFFHPKVDVNVKGMSFPK